MTRSRIASHLQKIGRSGIRDFFELVGAGRDVISLSIGEPDFVTPWHIRESSIFSLDRGATSYTSNRGLPELRRAAAAYVENRIGISYDADEEVLVTVGVSEALDLAVRAVVEPGDEVLYHEPCYVSYAPVVAMAHGVPVPVATRHEDEFRLTREMLEEKVTKRTRLLMLNFPTNPTGAALSRSDAEEIAAFAVEHDLVVITDEIYAELTYGEERVSVASMPGMRERTIYLNGCSKAWAMTGFRIGFACAPPDLTEAMMKIHQYTMLCAPILSQKAAVEALTRGEADMLEMVGEYEKRRNFIHSSLNEIGLPCSLPKGAFYIFPSVRSYGMDARTFSLKLLEEEKVACVPGTAFGAAGEGYVRCAYAADLDDIREAMTRMDRFLGKLRKG